MSIDKRKKIAATPKHWIRLTRTCNNRCIFCLDKESQDGSFVKMSEIMKGLRQGRNQKINKVILSGGEPTLHPEFLDIVKSARAIGYRQIQVITNGRMFAYGDFLKQSLESGVSEITFSMPGHNRVLYEKQTRVRGSFRQSLAGLSNALAAKGLIVNVDIVINKLNVKYLSDIIRFYQLLGVSEFDLLQVVPFGEAWDNSKDVFYDIAKEKAVLDKAFALSSDPKLYIWTNRFPAEYLENFEVLIQDPLKLYDEIRGRRDIFERFLMRGRDMPCLGERCRYCFLKHFCEDLLILRQKGELTGFRLPVCLEPLKTPQADKNSYCLDRKRPDIERFLKFFIKHRYFIKSLRCKACSLDRCCPGMQCDYIRKHGFRSVRPIINNQGIRKILQG